MNKVTWSEPVIMDPLNGEIGKERLKVDLISNDIFNKQRGKSADYPSGLDRSVIEIDMDEIIIGSRENESMVQRYPESITLLEAIPKSPHATGQELIIVPALPAFMGAENSASNPVFPPYSFGEFLLVSQLLGKHVELKADWTEGFTTIIDELDLNEESYEGLRSDLEAIHTDWSRDAGRDLYIEASLYQESSRFLADLTKNGIITNRKMMKNLGDILFLILKQKLRALGDGSLYRATGMVLLLTTQNILGNPMLSESLTLAGLDPRVDMAYFKPCSVKDLKKSGKRPSEIVERAGRLLFIRRQVILFRPDLFEESGEGDMERFPYKIEAEIVVDLINTEHSVYRVLVHSYDSEATPLNSFSIKRSAEKVEQSKRRLC